MCADKTKPIAAIASYSTKYLVQPTYGYNKKDEQIIKHQEPSIAGKVRAKIDEDYRAINDQILKLSLDAKSLKFEQFDERGKIEKEIEALKNKQARLVSGNLIELDKFDFITEFEACKGYVDKLTDPTLIGLINLLSRKDIDRNEIIKILIDKYDFNDERTTESKEYPQMFKDILNDAEKYNVKIFNNSVRHPIMKDKLGNPIIRKIGVKKDATPEYMLSYIMRPYPYFNGIVKFVVDGVSDEQIMISIINSEIRKRNSKSDYRVILDNYSKLATATEADAKALSKTISKDDMSIINILKSAASAIKELRTYEYLKQDYAIYDANQKIYKYARELPISTETTFDFMVSVTRILRELYKIKLDDEIFSEFIKQSGIKIPKSFKKNVLRCVAENKDIMMIDDTPKEEGKKPEKILLDYYQFLKSDFDKMGTPKGECFDVDKYAKFSAIINPMIYEQLTKNVKIALGLRIVIEIQRIIMKQQLNGNYDFIITC